MTDKLDTSKLIPLDVTGLEPIDEQSKPLNVSGLEPLDVSGLEPVDAPPMQSVAAAEPAPVATAFTPAAGSSSQAYTPVIPKVEEPAGKTIWNRNDGVFHKTIKPGEPIGIVYQGKKMMAVFDPTTGKFKTEIDDPTKIIKGNGLPAWTDAFNMTADTSQDRYGKVELDPSQVEAFAEGKGALRSIRNTALRALPSTATSFAAFNAGGIPAAAYAGRVHPYLAPVGFVVGGGLSAMGVGALTDLGVNAMFPLDENDELNQILYPTQNAITQQGVAIAALRPSARTLAGIVQLEKPALIQAGKGAALNTALAGQHRLVEEITREEPFSLGNVFAPGEMAKDAAHGAFLMHKATAMGRAFEYPGKVLGAKLSPTPKPTASTEELRAASQPLDTSGLEPVAAENKPAAPTQPAAAARPEGSVEPRPIYDERFKGRGQAGIDEFTKAWQEWDAKNKDTHHWDGTPKTPKPAPAATEAPAPQGKVPPRPNVPDVDTASEAEWEAFRRDSKEWDSKYDLTHFYDGTPLSEHSIEIRRRIREERKAAEEQAAANAAEAKTDAPATPAPINAEGTSEAKPDQPRLPEGIDILSSEERAARTAEHNKKLKEVNERPIAETAEEAVRQAEEDYDAWVGGNAAKLREQAKKENTPDPKKALELINQAELIEAKKKRLRDLQKAADEDPDKYGPVADAAFDHITKLQQRAREQAAKPPAPAEPAKTEPAEPVIPEAKESPLEVQLAHLREQRDRLAATQPEPGTTQEAQLRKLEQAVDNLEEKLKKANSQVGLVRNEGFTPGEVEALRKLGLDSMKKRLAEMEASGRGDSMDAKELRDIIAAREKRSAEAGKEPIDPAQQDVPAEPQDKAPDVAEREAAWREENPADTTEPTKEQVDYETQQNVVKGLERQLAAIEKRKPDRYTEKQKQKIQDTLARERAKLDAMPVPQKQEKKKKDATIFGDNLDTERIDHVRGDKFLVYNKQGKSHGTNLEYIRQKLPALYEKALEAKRNNKDDIEMEDDEFDGEEAESRNLKPYFDEPAKSTPTYNASSQNLVTRILREFNASDVSDAEKNRLITLFKSVINENPTLLSHKAYLDAAKTLGVSIPKAPKGQSFNAVESIGDDGVIKYKNIPFKEAPSRVDDAEYRRMNEDFKRIQKDNYDNESEQPNEREAKKPDKSGKETPVNEENGFETEIGGIKFRSRNVKMLDSEEEATRYTFVKKTSPGKGALIGIDIGTDHLTGDFSVKMLTDTGKRHTDGAVIRMIQTADIVIPKGIKTVDQLLDLLKKGTLTEHGPNWNNPKKPGKDAKAIKKLLDSVTGEGEAGQGAKPKPKVTPPDAGQGKPVGADNWTPSSPSLDPKTAPFDYEKVIKHFSTLMDIADYKPLGRSKKQAQGRVENMIKQLEKIFPGIKDAVLEEGFSPNDATREEALEDPGNMAKLLGRYLSRKFRPYRDFASEQQEAKDKSAQKDQPAEEPVELAEEDVPPGQEKRITETKKQIARYESIKNKESWHKEELDRLKQVLADQEAASSTYNGEERVRSGLDKLGKLYNQAADAYNNSKPREAVEAELTAQIHALRDMGVSEKNISNWLYHGHESKKGVPAPGLIGDAFASYKDPYPDVKRRTFDEAFTRHQTPGNTKPDNSYSEWEDGNQRRMLSQLIWWGKRKRDSRGKWHGGWGLQIFRTPGEPGYKSLNFGFDTKEELMAEYDKLLRMHSFKYKSEKAPKTEPVQEAGVKDIEGGINDKINELADEVRKEKKAAAEAETEQDRKNALLRAHGSEQLLKKYSLALEDTKLFKKAGFSLDGDGDVRGHRYKTWIDKSGKFAISHVGGTTKNDSNGYFKIVSVENGEVMPFKEIKQFANSQNDPHSGLRMAISHIESIRGKGQPAVEPAKPPVQEAAQEPAEKKYPIEKLEDALAEKGLKILRRNNTDDFVAEGGVEDNGRQRPTLVVGDTKITLASEGMELVNGKVQIMDAQDKDAAGNVIYSIERIVTAPEGRNKGSASKALDELTEAADKAGLTLQLEPTPFRSLIGKGESLNKGSLIEWYKKYGFEQKTEGSDAILIRKPGAKPERPKGWQGISDEQLRERIDGLEASAKEREESEPHGARNDRKLAQQFRDELASRQGVPDNGETTGGQYGDEVGRKKAKQLQRLRDKLDILEMDDLEGSKDYASIKDEVTKLEKDISENHKELWGKKNADVLEHVRNSIKDHNDNFEPTEEWIRSHPGVQYLSNSKRGFTYDPKSKNPIVVDLHEGISFETSGNRDAAIVDVSETFPAGTPMETIAKFVKERTRIDPYSSPSDASTNGSMLRQRIAEIRKEMKSGEGTTLDMRRDPEEDQSGWAKERMDKLFKEWRERNPDATELDFWKEARKRTESQTGGGWFDDIAWRQGVEVNNWPKHKALRDLINQKLDENTRDLGLQKTWTHEDGTKIITDGDRFFAYDKDGNSIGPRDGETSFKSIVHRIVQHGDDIQFREGSGYRAKQKQNEYDRRIDKVRDEITEARRDGNEVLTQLKLKELESLLTESKRWFEGALEQKEARDQSRSDRKSSYENEKKWTLDETLDSRRDPNNDANDAFDMEERKARELDRRVKQNAENREAGKEEDGGRRGFIGIMDRAVSEARMRGEITEKEVEGLSRIINYVGSQFFGGVKMSIRQGRPGHQGQYDVANRIVTIFKEAIQRGKFEDTAGHEVGHHLEQFLPEGDRAALRAEWQAARKEFVKKWATFGRLVGDAENWGRVKVSPEAYDAAIADMPTLSRFFTPEYTEKGKIKHYRVKPTEEMYRLFSPREWFAETFKDAAREKLNNDPAYTGEQAGWKQKVVGLWNSIKTAFNQMFGREQAKRILANFAKGRYKPEDADPSIYSESDQMFSKREKSEAEQEARLTPEERDAIDEERRIARDEARGEKPELNAGGKVWRSVVDSPFVSWFKPISMRMRTIGDLNPQSEALQKLVNDFSLIPGKEATGPDFNTDVANMRNVFYNKLTRAFGTVLEDMHKMPAAERAEFDGLFIRAMEGRLPRKLTGEVGAAVERVRAVMEEMHKYATDNGLKMGKVEGYFPRSVDANLVAADEKGFIRAATRAYEKQFERLQAEAEKEAIENGTEYVRPEAPDFDMMARNWRTAIMLGHEGLDFEHGLFDSRKEATRESFQKGREFSKEEALEFDEFRDKDVERIVSNYVGAVVRRSELVRRIGDSNDSWKSIKMQMDKQGVSVKDINAMEELIKSNIGINGKRIGESTQQALDFTKLVSNAAYLKLTGLLNYAEAASIGIRAESPIAGAKAVFDMFARSGNMLTRLTPEQTKDAKNEIEAIYGKGHDLASALAIEFGINTIDRGFGTVASGYHLDGGSDFQGKLNRASDGVYRMYGIHATEAAKREVSIRAGADFIDTTIKWLEGTHNLQRIGKAMGKEVRADNLAKQRLKELGLTEAEIPKFVEWVKKMRSGNESSQLRDIMSNDPMAQKYSRALILFNKQASVQASRASRSEAANDTAIGKLFFQFTTFTNEWSAQHGRRMVEQSKKVFGDKKYNATEKMLMAGVAPAFALATAATWGIRTIINKITGFQYEDGDKVPAWVRSLADAFVYTGVMGPAESVWKLISRGQLPAGVVGDWVKKAVQTAQALADNPESNAAQRNAVSMTYRSAAVPAVASGLALAADAGPLPVKLAAGLAAQVVANNRTEKSIADLVAGEEETRGSNEMPTPPRPPRPGAPGPR